MAKIDIEAMDRRTFVLLTGAASGALIRPPVRLSAPPLVRGALGVGRLRFELDERHRWSLWYSGDARPVPLVRDAELGAWIGGAFVTLADLQDSTVGSRRPPGGEAKVEVSRTELEAVSEWLPARPLRPEGDASTLRLCYQPRGDGLEALDLLFAPISPVDRERLATAAVPTGWCSWYELSGGVTEADMIANLEFCAAHFDRRFFSYVQLDDGYQRATGDWQANDKFPHGHRWLSDQIHARGFKAGLWVAPFAVAERSGVPAQHPDWLLKNADGAIVWDTRDDWGGKVHSLDGAHPEVERWLYDLGRRIVRDWGYDYVKIDFLLWATAGATHYGGLTHAEAYRKGLAAIRDGLGPEVFLVGCGAPLQHAAGFLNALRIGGDVDTSWGGIQGPARAAALRSFYHRTVWLNDPNCLVVRPPLTEREAQAGASIVAVTGGATLFSDNLPKLPPERVAILQRTIPVAPVAGRPVGAIAPESAVAPALVSGP